MLKKAFFGALIPSVLLCNCGQRMDKRQLAIINEGLVRSDHFIEGSIDEKLHESIYRRYDPRTKSRADLWAPTVQSIHSQTDSLVFFLNRFATLLVAKGYLADNNRLEVFDRLKRYKTALIASFGPDLPDRVKVDILEYAKQLPILKDTMVEVNYPEITVELLNKLRVDAHITEDRMLRYCLMHTELDFDGFDRFAILAGLNSTHFKSGEPVIVYSGVGSFSYSVQPKIMINGREREVNAETGMAKDTLKAPGDVGRHGVRIEIEYTKPDGKRATLTEHLSYTVDSRR